MSYDPFLDPPLRRPGCLTLAAAVVLVLAAGLVWGPGDGAAVAAELFLVWIGVTAWRSQSEHDRALKELERFARMRAALGTDSPARTLVVGPGSPLLDLERARTSWPAAPDPFGFPIVVSSAVDPDEAFLVPSLAPELPVTALDPPETPRSAYEGAWRIYGLPSAGRPDRITDLTTP